MIAGLTLLYCYTIDITTINFYTYSVITNLKGAVNMRKITIEVTTE